MNTNIWLVNARFCLGLPFAALVRNILRIKMAHSKAVFFNLFSQFMFVFFGSNFPYIQYLERPKNPFPTPDQLPAPY